MKTKLKLITLIGVGIFCFAFAVNAQTPGPLLQEGFLVATVNIYNAALASQSSDGLHIVFDLSNRVNVQPQVKYAVNLAKEEKDSQIIIDTKIYPEEISLKENETINKKITYVPPAFLSGDYKLYIEAKNPEGLILAMAYIGDVQLNGNNQGLFLDPAACHLTLEGDETQKKYTLQGVDVKPEENILLNCEVENKFNSSITVIPNVATYYRSVFGKFLGAKDFESITLNKGEKTVKSFVLPKAVDPQSYDAVLTFYNERKQLISNQIIAHYIIQGPSATIQNVLLDKAVYQKGEIAKLFFYYTQSDSNFPGSRSGITDIGVLTASINLKNQNNQNCADLFQKELTEKESFFNFGIPIINTCQSPQAEVVIKGKDSRVLAQNTFKFFNEEKKESETGGKTAANKQAMIIILIVIILIAIVATYFIKKKLNKSNNFSLFIFLFMFLVIAGMFTGEIAKADTYAAGYGITVNYGLNKKVYSPGETMSYYLSASRPAIMWNATASMNGVTRSGNYGGYGTNTTIYLSFTAPNNSGNNLVSSSAAIWAQCDWFLYCSYTVQLPALSSSVLGDGVCGSSNGGNSGVAPTVNLCSAGAASAVSGSGPWTWTCTGSPGYSIATCGTNLLTRTLTVNKTGTGSGTVTSTPAGINCGSDCSASYNDGTSVTLTATPSEGSTFTGWLGACSGTGACTVKMIAARSVTATFKSYNLTVTKTGTGSGTVTPSTGTLTWSGKSGSASYYYNTPITLTAASDTGSTFTGWSGTGIKCPGTGDCTVIMTVSRSVRANFNINTYFLTVTKNGTGSGTVRSNWWGINCGFTCSAKYNYNTSVTLTATAAAGYTFTGWSGDCSGNSACVVTMDAAKFVTATFNSSCIPNSACISITPDCSTNCGKSVSSQTCIDLNNCGTSFSCSPPCSGTTTCPACSDTNWKEVAP
ncbi:MAG: InlB B-repeat-containing protein [Patescibacteria group bacterium]